MVHRKKYKEKRIEKMVNVLAKAQNQLQFSKCQFIV